MRYSGARVFLTPSHVKASRTAAIVVRRRLAAERSEWESGVLVGWVVGRGDWLWQVVGSVVVAVDMLLVTCLHEGGLRNRTGGRNLMAA